jgi:hypothetical protein
MTAHILRTARLFIMFAMLVCKYQEVLTSTYSAASIIHDEVKGRRLFISLPPSYDTTDNRLSKR